MVYHEIRRMNGKKQNYLIFNKREKGKWVKKSKFIGLGEISKEDVMRLKKEFELELKMNKIYDYLAEKQVEEIEMLKQAYFEKVGGLSREEFEKFEHSFFTELTYNSNAIEGNSMSLEETALVVDDNIAPKGKEMKEIYEARNHMDAIEFIKGYKKDVSEEFVLKLHSIILKDISGRFAGRYRENEVRIFGSDARFPKSIVVPQLVKGLVYWYNKYKKELHPFELAIIFSMKFVSIHPFVDGNGRTSRLLMNFILNRNHYPWIGIRMRKREEYLNAVRNANEESYGEIIGFAMKTMKENLKAFEFL